MAHVNLLTLVAQIRPQAWDAIIPHGPRVAVNDRFARVALNPQPLPPFPDPNVFSYAWFGFSAGDPTLSFTVTSGETTFAFSNVPEPTALTLLGAALAGIGFAPRRKLS